MALYKEKGDEVIPISDSQLLDYVQANVIKKARVAVVDGGYVLCVGLTWKSGEHMVYTVRKQPRVWVSLDRMLSHLMSSGWQLKTLELDLSERKRITGERVKPRMQVETRAPRNHS